MSDSLSVYLHDHYAGSHFAVELLDSLQEQYKGEPLAAFAQQLAKEIEQDRHALRLVINSVGKTHLDVAEALGWFSEKAAQIKLQRDRNGGLGTFEALEMITLGIRGKLGLWKVLPIVRATDSRVPELDYVTLQARAQTQLNQTEEQWLRLAATTFAPAP